MRSELQIVTDELRRARQELAEERQRHSLHARLEEQAVKIELLRTRLRDQTQQTQQTAQQKHDAVLEAINRHGGVPEGIDPQGHPIEQIVGTVLAVREAEAERLRAALDAAEVQAEHHKTMSLARQDEVERLRADLHHCRGLLETACDAWECGHVNSLLGMQQLHLTGAWYEAARDAAGGGE